MWSLFGFDEGKPEGQTTKHHTMEGDEEVMLSKSIEQALECDYEKDCTTLYKQVEEENWPAIAKFLETGYWPGNFFADAIPPADQVRTWVTRFDHKANNRVRWSQLPLHLAIVVEAPYEIIGSLIELYPQAVRCTDDQHMLPLHLAMRHGSSDNVVDLLLAAFPEAVNAKGKNDRTPIDCAIRGPNKIRGRILGTFVERAKAKATKSVTNSYSREVAQLRAKLEDKENELGDVKSKLAAVDTAKAALELDLTTKMSDIRPSKTTEKDVEEQDEIKNKIMQLEQEKADLQRAQERARAEERRLIEELETVHAQVAKSASPEDILALKEEIRALKESRETSEKERSQAEIEEMKKHIEEELIKADDANREELQAMKANIEELHRVASVEVGESHEELSALKDQVEGLRQELKAKETAAKLKADLAILKEELAIGLKDTDTKTEEQISAIEAALESLKATDLETKSNEELLELKTELENLKEDMKERRLADKLTEDTVKLRRRVDGLTIPPKGKSKDDILAIKKTLDAIKVAELQSKSDEELLALSKHLKMLKEQLSELEEASKIRGELTELKKKLEAELKENRGSKKSTTAPIKAAIQKIQKLETKTVFELVALKFELESVHDQIKLKQELQVVKDDVRRLKVETSKHLSKATGKNKDEFESIMKTLYDIDIKILETKNREELVVAKFELSKAKNRLADKELAIRLKAELREARTSFQTDVLRCEEESNQKGAEDLKAIIEKLEEGEIDSKTTQELIQIKDEVSKISVELKEKAQVFRDLEAIKCTLNDLLERREGTAKQALLAMKDTVEAIDPNELDMDDEAEWNDLKTQINILKQELEDSEIARKTTQELIILKQALEKVLNECDGKTKEELTAMKTTIDSIDISKLDADNYDEWKELKAEVDGLKRDLKMKECQGMIASIRDQLKLQNGLSKIEIARTVRRITGLDQSLAGKTYSELVETQKELDSIIADLPASKVNTGGHSSPNKGSTKTGLISSPNKGSTKSGLTATTDKEGTSKSAPSQAKSPRKKFFARFRPSKKPQSVKGATASPAKNQDVNMEKPQENSEQEGNEEAARSVDEKEASSEPQGTLVKAPSSTGESNGAEKKGSFEEQTSKLEKKPSVASATQEDRDTTASEEKKEDPDEPRSAPPVAPMKPTMATPQTQDVEEDETEIKETQSKTLISPDGEVEAVVVE